jgi:hypothetical protein
MPGWRLGFPSRLLARSGHRSRDELAVFGDGRLRVGARGLMPMTVGSGICTPMLPVRSDRHVACVVVSWAAWSRSGLAMTSDEAPPSMAIAC